MIDQDLIYLLSCAVNGEKPDAGRCAAMDLTKILQLARLHSVTVAVATALEQSIPLPSYFMEEKYGPRGNLQTRDVVAREIDKIGKQVFLDISFLAPKEIEQKLPEVKELCKKYGDIDITKELSFINQTK